MRRVSGSRLNRDARMPGTASGGFEKAIAKGVGCDRAVVALIEHVIDADKELGSVGEQIHCTPQSQRDGGIPIVEVFGSCRAATRGRAVEIIGPVPIGPLRFEFSPSGAG